MHYAREIPREDWAEFLAVLSSLSRTRRVRIDASHPESDEQPLSQSLPLVGIRLAEEEGQPGRIEVIVGRPGEEITHRLLGLERIHANENESGDLQSLTLQDGGRFRMLIFFEPSEVFLECVSTPSATL
jgi:hypothetical protein